ncbi:MAG: translation initiation factor IF-6 [Candidatus Diapherotrites archaeon]|nr:translation initiation factor IF-6 [Candidatus Diapherotrites archaeon]
MKIVRRTIRGSPYVGVFGCVTEKIGLFPIDAEAKEIKDLEDLLGVEIVQAKLAESSLIGVLAEGNSKGFVTGEIATDNEINYLKEIGVKVKRIQGITAIGNLLEANDYRGLCSAMVKPKTRKEIGDFLGIELKAAKVADSDLVGSCLVATNKGFVLNTNATDREFEETKKFFGVNGSLSTANYGDVFLGNSVIANSKAAITGIHTSASELLRIDEGLSD